MLSKGSLMMSARPLPVQSKITTEPTNPVGDVDGGKQLTHLTKGRARGPKKRYPIKQAGETVGLPCLPSSCRKIPPSMGSQSRVLSLCPTRSISRRKNYRYLPPLQRKNLLSRNNYICLPSLHQFQRNLSSRNQIALPLCPKNPSSNRKLIHRLLNSHRFGINHPNHQSSPRRNCLTRRSHRRRISFAPQVSQALQHATPTSLRQPAQSNNVSLTSLPSVAIDLPPREAFLAISSVAPMLLLPNPNMHLLKSSLLSHQPKSKTKSDCLYKHGLFCLR